MNYICTSLILVSSPLCHSVDFCFKSFRVFLLCEAPCQCEHQPLQGALTSVKYRSRDQNWTGFLWISGEFSTAIFENFFWNGWGELHLKMLRIPGSQFSFILGGHWTFSALWGALTKHAGMPSDSARAAAGPPARSFWGGQWQPDIRLAMDGNGSKPTLPEAPTKTTNHFDIHRGSRVLTQ